MRMQTRVQDKPKLQAITRRFLVGSVFAAPVAATAASFPALAQSIAAAPECPDIIALGEQIEPLMAKYRAAAAKKAEALALAKSLCPPVPDELVDKGSGPNFFPGCYGGEQDFEGRYLHPHRGILKAKSLRQIVGNPRTKAMRRIRQLIKMADAYEAGFEAARENSGLKRAHLHVHMASNDVDNLARALLKLTPRTMAGVMIFARAAAAYDEAAGDGWRNPLSNKVSAALLRIQVEGV